eukprot:GAHX01000331.1.p1 GENE.GAHX01000331.1~~GAHX01000331.1.p1  ORF type:complete len:887 (+),score=195.16 GAHX01000331.1:37-2697(+)
MRLSEKFVPIQYNVKLHPDYNSLDTYKGIVEILCEVKEATSSFQLHADKTSIELTSLLVISGNKSTALDLAKTTYDERNFIRTFELPAGCILAVGKVSLLFEFDGKIRKDMAGFYTSTYKALPKEIKDNEETYKKYRALSSKLVSTQFEALHARKAIPCFDEPSFKAAFKVSISLPKDLEGIVTVLSNMPVVSKEQIKFGETERVLYNYDITPKMSTYLLAWAIGMLEYTQIKNTSKRGKERTISVYTVKGKLKTAEFSLRIAERSLEFFENLFKIDYPLTKLDLIAIPDFNHGAMENWGLITFREICMLVDEKTSFGVRRYVASVVAHEVGHMWFGNLVTMKWWDGLWLNEGFATFVMFEAAAVAAKNETLRDDLLFGRSKAAYLDDSLQCSKPIEQHISCIEDIQQMFDAIRYAKGGTVLRMLSEWAGLEQFGEALKVYLSKYQYDNASSAQLFEVLEQELKLPIVKMMDSFIRQPGVPIITTSIEGDKLVLKQSKFTNDESKDGSLWSLPVFIKKYTKNGKEDVVYLEEETKSVKLSKEETKAPVVVNSEEKGYYIVEYSETLLDTIIASHSSIDTNSLLKIFKDLVLLLKYRKLKMEKVLEFIEKCFATTKHPFVLAEIKELVYYWGLFDNEKAKKFLQTYIYANCETTQVIGKYKNIKSDGYLFEPVYTEKQNDEGVSDKEHEFNLMFEQYTLASLSEIARSAVADSRTMEDARIIISNLSKSTNLPNALLKLVYDSYAIGNIDKLEKEFKSTDNSEIQGIVLSSLGLVEAKDIGRSFNFGKSDSVKLQDKYSLFCALLTRNKNRKDVLDLLLKEKEYIYQIYGKGTLLGHIARTCAVFNDKESLEKVERMFAGHETVKTQFVRTVEKINNNILFKEFYGK